MSDIDDDGAYGDDGSPLDARSQDEGPDPDDDAASSLEPPCTEAHAAAHAMQLQAGRAAPGPGAPPPDGEGGDEEGGGSQGVEGDDLAAVPQPQEAAYTARVAKLVEQGVVCKEWRIENWATMVAEGPVGQLHTAETKMDDPEPENRLSFSSGYSLICMPRLPRNKEHFAHGFFFGITRESRSGSPQAWRVMHFEIHAFKPSSSRAGNNLCRGVTPLDSVTQLDTRPSGFDENGHPAGPDDNGKKVRADEVAGFVEADGSLHVRVLAHFIPHRVADPEMVQRVPNGLVGIVNSGATCYLNSLMQTLFHTNAFRRAIFQIPVPELDSSGAGDGSSGAPPPGGTTMSLALQRVMFQLQTETCAVELRDLLRAFGWTANEQFQQHDVQEMLRVLLERVESIMKGTAADGEVGRLFEGVSRSFIKCKDVDVCSHRDETWADVQLDVKGCATLQASLAKYVVTEEMTGDNQYEAEGHGKQDATKGLRFLKLPPVLHLQLKRFELGAGMFGSWGPTKVSGGRSRAAGVGGGSRE
jgi:hypothetical protein